MTSRRRARTSKGIFRVWNWAGRKLKTASPQETMDTVIVSM